MHSKLSVAAALTAVALTGSAAFGQTTVYENTSTGLGAGSLPVFDLGETLPRVDAQEVGDVVTLATGSTDRELDSIRIGWFTQDDPNDGVDDDRFIADLTFRLYPLDDLGEVIDTPFFESTVVDFLWNDGAFANNISFPATVGGTTVLPESFAYTLALGERRDDPDTPGDGLQTSFSLNSRGPVTTGSSPDGILRRNDGAFETIVFASGRQTRLTINTLPITTFLPGDANADGTVDLADFGLLRANFGSSGAEVGFRDGDFNQDGSVDLADFGLLRANFGGSSSDVAALDAWYVTVVPEPSTLALAGLAGFGLLRRCRG
ncbi:MAG: dockerin type I domain-containing protein [Planctomycetota bacterium]